MSKFNSEFLPGTKVKIKNHMTVDDWSEPVLFLQSMTRYYGQIFTIQQKYEEQEDAFFLIEVPYVWHKSWLDVVE